MYNHNCTPYTLNYVGGLVVHSYGRLIPHEFPITDLQQISDSCGIGRINCTDSSGRAMFSRPGKKLEVAGVTSTTRNKATLVVKRNNVSGFQLYCISTISTFFSLSLSNAS